MTAFADRVGFCVGTGRCGTTFLAHLAGREPDVAASHERLRLGATFHMFCQWHRIPIDHEGFLRDREDAVRADLAAKRFSFESSALLSHSLEPLFDRFRARFLLLVRSPAETVASFAVRGWFRTPAARADHDRPPSYREGEEPRHFFGRIIPHGAEFDQWCQLTPLGRIAWFWQARNRAILDQLRRLPADHARIMRLEDLDPNGYRQVADFFGWPSQVDAATFADLAQARPNAGPNPPRRFPDWSKTEAAEFEVQVGPLAAALGYEYRISELARQSDLGVKQPLPPLPAVIDALASAASQASGSPGREAGNEMRSRTRDDSQTAL
jgi:hypothetical protein